MREIGGGMVEGIDGRSGAVPSGCCGVDLWCCGLLSVGVGVWGL